SDLDWGHGYRRSAFLKLLRRSSPYHIHVRYAQLPAGRVTFRFDVDTLFDADGVPRPELTGELSTDIRDQSVVDVSPPGRVFQIWVHSRKRRRHNKPSGRRLYHRSRCSVHP